MQVEFRLFDQIGYGIEITDYIGQCELLRNPVEGFGGSGPAYLSTGLFPKFGIGILIFPECSLKIIGIDVGNFPFARQAVLFTDEMTFPGYIAIFIAVDDVDLLIFRFHNMACSLSGLAPAYHAGLNGYILFQLILLKIR